MSYSNTPAETCPTWNWREHLSREEMTELMHVSDARAWLSILLNWALVGASFALVAVAPNPFTVVVALVVIGARQLGFAILMHDAAHRVLLRDRRWNDRIGNWLAAYPIWSDLHPYRRYHLQHHAKTWTREDPDLGLATPFPVTRASLRRKIWRDLSGQTGWKRAKATLRRDLGISQGKTRRMSDAGWRSLRGVVVSNAVLLGLLTAFGHPALYLLWLGAWFTTYSLVMRIRAIAEHAMVPDPSSLLGNTRTTLPSWWERLTIAPNNVNYHLEHHLVMTVPQYRLPRMHALLRDRGVLDGACLAYSYLEVLRLASSREDAAPAEAPDSRAVRNPPF